ncbi:MAG: PH domain-containing protein [Lachnospiraceae bacterium]|nr:PH domain-containing protein [Lachnospiraceae bacterium]
MFGLPWTFTTYSINKDVLTVNTGFFNKQENDCYMYKIQDVKLKSTFAQRMSGLGDVICYTGDTTDRELILKNIKNSKEVKNYILKNSEVARLKRRTLNTLNIGAGDIDVADSEI